MRTLTVALAFLVAAPVFADQEAGLFAAIQGKVQYQRRGVWNDASVGLPVLIGDRVRTSGRERAKLVMQDNSVLDLGPGTELVIDESASASGQQKPESAFRLFQGRVLAGVSEKYGSSGGHFEIETPNAVASVRGTWFLVSHDDSARETDVVAVNGSVEVSSKGAGADGGRVQLGPKTMTRVRKGNRPSAAESMDDAQLRQSLQGIQIIGTGKRDGLNVFHPVLAGRLIGSEDVPGGPPAEAGGAKGLGTSAPGLPPAAAASMDVYTNTQPLNVFRAFPPGRPPAGSAQVNF